MTRAATAPEPAPERRATPSRTRWRASWMARAAAPAARHAVLAWLALPAMLSPLPAVRAQAPAPADSVLRRAQRLVNEGSGTAGRTLLDSVLAATPTAAPRYAEALFWRAALGESATKAEQDYQRLTTEHALSPWAGEALLRLGQLQFARGERSVALRYFARLVVEHAETPLAAPGLFWKARVLLEQNDVGPACDALREAKARALPGAIELRNQVDYYAQRCTADATAPAGAAGGSTSGLPAAGSAPPGGVAPATSSPTPSSGPRLAAARAPEAPWSVQVAAFRTRVEAAKSARALVQRGYEARVDGDEPPFRVRIGRYAARGDAAAALARMKKKKLAGTVVRSGATP